MDIKNIDEGHPDGEKPLHFYYNREERIARAPKIVQDYYSGKFDVQKKGLFKTLFATRQNKFMFSGIIIFMAFIWIYNFFQSNSVYKIAGTTAELSAFSYDENVYVSLYLKESEKANLQVPVSVIFYAIDNSGSVCNEFKTQDIYAGRELFIRTKFSDYDIIQIKADVSAFNDTKSLISGVERR